MRWFDDRPLFGRRIVVTDLAALRRRAGMTDRTRVLFLSHITSPTALLFPIERSIAEARKRGIWSVIDGAHTPGHIPLELDRPDEVGQLLGF